MKRNIFIFLFIIFLGIVSHAQNWLIYTTLNSNTPYSGYSKIAIDTSNNKYFNYIYPASGTGDKTVLFDNDTLWEVKNNVYMSGTFGCYMFKVDKKNVLWEVSINHDVYSLVNGIGGSWMLYDASNTGLTAMENWINYLAVDNSNNKWFAGVDGLIKYNDTIFTLMDTTNSNLPFEPINRILADKDNSGDSKIAKYDGANWQVYSPPFTAGHILRMTADSNNVLWLSTGVWGDGFYRFDENIWTNYTTTNSGIQSDVASVVAIDKNNLVWTNYTTGITSFDGVVWTNYDNGNGSGYPAFHGAYEIQVDRYNNKWICTFDGVVVYNETGVVGVNEINKQMGALNLYPNPAKDVVTMSIETENQENVTLTILNSLGQSVKPTETRNVQKGKNDLQIDISELKSGIYFIQVKSSRGVVSKKIIRQ